jgi:hypothetical protein
MLLIIQLNKCCFPKWWDSVRYKTIFSIVVLFECEPWPLTLREQHILRMLESKLRMTSVLDHLRQEPRPKMWQKCERLSWKTEGERFTMLVTLSNCRMERVAEFCRVSSTCGPPWQRARLHVAPRVAVFDFNENYSHLPLSLLTRPRPLWCSLISENEIEAQGATYWEHGRDPGRIAGRGMTSSSASDHGNPAGIAVLTQKGMLRRRWRRIKISISG